MRPNSYLKNTNKQNDLFGDKKLEEKRRRSFLILMLFAFLLLNGSGFEVLAQTSDPGRKPNERVTFFGLLKRREDFSRPDFLNYWQNKHALLVLKLSDPTRRYVQNRRLDIQVPGLLPAPADGVAQNWFASLEEVSGLLQSQEYKQTLAIDEKNFISGGEYLFTTDEVVIPGRAIGKSEKLFKILVFLKRREGMSVEDFQRQWRTSITRQTMSKIPNIVRYVKNYVLPETYQKSDQPPPAYDGVAEIWWKGRESFYADQRIPELEIEETQTFFDLKRSAGLIVEELRQRWY